MNIKTLARCVDQPILLNKLQKNIPTILVGVGTAYGVYDTYNCSKNRDNEFKKKKFLKNSIIIATTIASSLAAANGLKLFGMQVVPRLIHQPSLRELLKKQKSAISDFLSSSKNLGDEVVSILNKAKFNYIKPKEIDILMKSLPQNEQKQKLFSVILPTPETLTSKEIFSEVGRLSLLGAIPVVGGVAGGIIADKVTDTASRKSTSNKIKEGFYQYFANIFLCNVGACAALFTAEQLQKSGKIKPLSSLQKMLVIMTGITATGIVGGSWIANKLSQKFIDPVLNGCKPNKNISGKGVYSERKPEMTDVALHVDDIATAGVLSGFKWIEPALPLMYFVSGYRAGIGYRNNVKN